MDKKLTVLITGASRGIGLALVKNFLNTTKVQVIAVSRTGKPKSLTQASFAGNLIWVQSEITTKVGREKVAHTLKDLGALDILIHNAGSIVYKPFPEITESDLTSIYQINVFAPFLLTQVLMPYMTKTHIVAVSSIGGVGGSLKFPGLSAYSSSKAALNGWIEVMAAEYGNTDLSFNALALGSVDTEMFSTAFPGADASCSVSEMADFISDFARNRGKLIRGKIISVSSSNP